MSQSAVLSLNHELAGRELEAYLLSRLPSSLNQVEHAQNSMEANVLGLTASLLAHRYPEFAQRCWNLHSDYFDRAGDAQDGEAAGAVSAAEMVRRGWVLGLPRWREAAERVARAEQ